MATQTVHPNFVAGSVQCGRGQLGFLFPKYAGRGMYVCACVCMHMRAVVCRRGRKGKIKYFLSWPPLAAVQGIRGGKSLEIPVHQQLSMANFLSWLSCTQPRFSFKNWYIRLASWKIPDRKTSAFLGQQYTRGKNPFVVCQSAGTAGN